MKPVLVINNSPNKREFMLLSILLIASRAFDVIATYIYTPNLKHESNILVNTFHLNTYSLAILQLILVIGIILCLRFYAYHDLYFDGQGKINIIKFYTLLSKGAKVSAFTAGYIVTRALIWAGLFAGTSTTLLINSTAYKELYTHYGVRFSYAIIAVICLYFLYSFYRKFENKFAPD